MESRYIIESEKEDDSGCEGGTPSSESNKTSTSSRKPVMGGGQAFGWVPGNRLQIVLLWLQAVFIGLSLRLTVFPQAELAADLGTWEVTSSPIATPADIHVEKRHAHIARQTAFLVSFGFTKAFGNLVIGRFCDKFGRKTAHSIGWFFGLVLSIMLLATREWSVVVAANIFLGLQQSIAWSTNIFMLTDTLGPRQRAWSNGLSNATGYIASAVSAYFAAGLLEWHSYNAAFMALFVVCMIGFGVSVICIKDTMAFVVAEVASESLGVACEPSGDSGCLRKCVKRPGENRGTDTHSSFADTFLHTCFLNPSTAVVCLAGLTVNMVTGLVWGLVLIWGREKGIAPFHEAYINVAYTLPKGLALLLSASLSDRSAQRKPMILVGMFIVIVGLCMVATVQYDSHEKDDVYMKLIIGAIVLGVGTGTVYPILGAAIGDHTPAVDRATALGIYRAWRDMGYAVCGVVPGAVSSPDDIDASFETTTTVVAVITAIMLVSTGFLYRERPAVLRRKGGDVVDSAL